MKPPFSSNPLSSGEEISSRNWFYIEEDFSRKTRWLILWRLVFISLFLLLTVFLHEKENLFLFPFSFPPLYFLIALQYFFSILYIFFLLKRAAIQPIALFQLFIDGLFVTAVVYVTGGIESFFLYLYFLVILASGTLFFRLGGILAASYAGVLYALLLLLQGTGKIPFYYGLTDQPPSYSQRYLIYQIVMNGMGFFFTGYLSSFFSEQSRVQRSQIEIQKKNIVQLKELNRIIIENLDIGLITLDFENKIQSINRAGERILGRNSGELINKPLTTVFPDLDLGPGPNALAEVTRQETSYEDPNGSVARLGFSFNRVKEDQSYGIGNIFSFKDISEIKAMEDHLRQVDRLALMGKMAAGIAHEVKNPLASISGSIQVLRDEYKEKGTGERLLKIISREVTKLDLLMNDFLAFTRSVQTIESRLDISNIILETIDLIRENKESPQTISWKLDVEPNLFFKISTGELSQVLWNFLINALQAVPSNGEIFIGARHHQTEMGEPCIEIRIRDNGPGIQAMDQAKIFEPFYTTKDRGTGLGLSIVQKIISDRGGKIRLNSSPGQGTEFIVIFPEG